MTLQQLRWFETIVSKGSFTRAARSVGITQPALSHAIASLERELGARLLFRGGSRVKLSPAGERIIVAARQLLQQFEEIRLLAVSPDVEEGRLRIGVISSAATRILPVALGRYRKLHPRVAVATFEGSDEEVAKWLQSAAIDVGLLANPLPAFKRQVVASDRVMAVLPKRHALSRKAHISVTSISEDPFIMSRAGCEPLIRSIYGKLGIEPRVEFEAHDVTTILEMVREGIGISMVPELALPERITGVSCLPLRPTVRREIVAATLAREPIPATVYGFLKLLTKEIAAAGRAIRSQKYSIHLRE